jgi:predicted metal-dependent phosphoesterase TrpH
MLKVELHAHTDFDPADHIPHTTTELIDHAVSLGYNALAVTLHNRYFDPAEWHDYASRRGLVLLAGIEQTIGHHHVLLVNFPAAIGEVRSFDEIDRLKRTCAGLVIAPHPCYPTLSALGKSTMNRYVDVIDAVEINAMYTRLLDFNRQAVAWAREHRKPLVGNTDLHVLDQMGTTYSLVDANPDADAICEAIRKGRVEVRTTPLPEIRAATLFSRMLWGGFRGRTARWLGRRAQP